MGLDSIILRQSAHAPLVTKNTELTFNELDQNFIELYDAIRAANNPGSTQAYSNSNTYSTGVFISFNGRLYRSLINSNLNNTPDISPTAWVEISIGELIHDKNRDTQLLTSTGTPLTADSLIFLIAQGGKKPTKVATTANITLSGLQTIDGIAVVADDRVLVKNQTTASQNGIYVVASGAWTRAVDFNEDAEVKGGLTVIVTRGTVGADTLWELTTDEDPIILGTTSLEFIKIGGTISGTQNFLVKYTAGGHTASQVFDNGTNVGIGTASPTARVHIQSASNSISSFALKIFNSNPTILFTIDDAGNTMIGDVFTSQANDLFQVRKDVVGDGAVMTLVNFAAPTLNNTVSFNTKTNSNFGGGFYSSRIETRNISGSLNDLIFYLYDGSTPGGTEKLRIQNNGNVGIGESIPTARLQIKGLGITSGFGLKVDNLSSVKNFYVGDNGFIGIGVDIPQLYNFSQDGVFVLKRGRLHAEFVDNVTNKGILIGSYNEPFESTSWSSISGGFTPRDRQLILNDVGQTMIGGNAMGNFSSIIKFGIQLNFGGTVSNEEVGFLSDDKNIDKGIINGYYIPTNGVSLTPFKVAEFNVLKTATEIGSNDRRTYFQWKNWNGTSIVERMRIDHEGRVGLGINAPTATFHINSSLNAEGGIGAFPVLVRSTTGAAGIHFDNSGVANTAEIRFTHTAGTVEVARMIFAPGGTSIHVNNVFNLRKLDFTVLFRVESDGKTAIGNGFFSPSAQLHVKSPGITTDFALKVDNPSTSLFSVRDDGKVTIGAGNTDATSFDWGMTSGFAKGRVLALGTAMNFDTEPNIHFLNLVANSNTDFDALKIKNTDAGISARSRVRFENNTGIALIFTASSTFTPAPRYANKFTIFDGIGGTLFESSVGWDWFIGTAQKMILNASGQLGIGTSTPKFVGHINGRLAYGVPNSAPTDADLSNSQVTAHLNAAEDTLTFRVKTSAGILKTGTVALV